MQPATSTFKRTRFIERDHRNYSLRLLVDELRMEARSTWKVMHQFRKKAAAEIEPECRRNYEYIEIQMRRQLTRYLSILNAGLDRSGSLDAAYYRRQVRDSDALRQRLEKAS